jgi:hypothetical protein
VPFVFAYYASRPCRSLTELDVKIESYVCFGRCRCRDVKAMLKTGASQASSEKFMRLRQEFVTTAELSAVHGRSTKFLQTSSASFPRYSVKPKATSMRRPSIIFSITHWSLVSKLGLVVTTLFPHVGPFAHMNDKASHAFPTKNAHTFPTNNAHAFPRKGSTSSEKYFPVRSDKPMCDSDNKSALRNLLVLGSHETRLTMHVMST